MKPSDLAGTTTLLRLTLRRDRWLLPLWVLLPALLIWGQLSFLAALPDWQGFLRELTTNPLTSAWLGPVVPLSVAGAVLWRGAIQGAIVLMLGALLTVVRHTRAEEEAGRSELIRGRAVGRLAQLNAALALALAASLAAGLLVSAVSVGGGLPAEGAVVLGLTLAVAGWLMAGLGALGAQLLGSARAARGAGLALVAASLVTMVLNHAGGGYTGWAWLSPLSWYRVTRPFAGDDGRAMLVLAALSAAPIGVAYVVAARRDLGGGLWQERPGPATAAPGLRSPLALAWRLQRGLTIGWAIALGLVSAAAGAIVPSVSSDIGTMLSTLWPERWVRFVEAVGSQEAFLAVSLYILLILVSGYGISAVLRLRDEEQVQRAELLLARPVSRSQWMASHVLIGAAGAAGILLAVGLGAGLGWGLAVGDLGATLPLALGLSVAKIPVAWVLVGAAALAYGLLPRWAAAASWGVLGALVLLELLWEAQLVSWSMLLASPFAYAHYTIPPRELAISPLLGLVALAGMLAAIGGLGFRRRDLS
ncbi:MAG: hypothetical protein DIU80_018290 [Chloroflexota bacterium]|nr:MAG: hypothetical protein DIU80_16375 [Chloroflexota bacterium]